MHLDYDVALICIIFSDFEAYILPTIHILFISEEANT